MVTTANPEYAERVRMMSLHGISKDAWKRYSAEGSWYYEISSPGFKYNMTDIAAALGLVQLGRCDQMLESRRRIAEIYNQNFRDLRGIVPPVVRAEADHAWHLYPIRLVLEQLRIGRSEFIAMMRERNIATSVHFVPLHLHPYYRNTYKYRPEDFPSASYAYQRIVSLPISSAMTDQDAKDVVAAVGDITTQSLR
jgi:dTDP-4-amino-4,6-dideoxygalactose transaminase